jgi:hypothetical protein
MDKLKALKAKQAELSASTDKMQKEAAEKLFEVNLENVAMFKTLTEHLNKHYTWTTKNAAVIVTLYDKLKTQGKELKQSDSEIVVVKLRGHELNGLYQSLLNSEGVGVEAARRFITMLTMVGEAVGVAMKELSELNDSINNAHKELQTIDAEILELEVPTEKVEAVLEETK